MDLNVVVLGGRLAAPPEIRSFESGSRLMRCLLTVRSHRPSPRIDVVPVTLWDPPDELVETPHAPGEPLIATGSVQRRFWTAADGRRSRLEIVARHVCPDEGSEYPLADATGRDLR
jgi:single-strand DNA-binding protein